MNYKRLKIFIDQVENPSVMVVQLILFKAWAKITRSNHAVYKWWVPIRQKDGFRAKYVFQIFKQLSPEDREFYRVLRDPKYNSMIDIGSFIGAVSEYFLRHGDNREVLCFEPQKLSREFSIKMLSEPENKNSSWIINKAALSDKTKFSQIKTRHRHDSDAYIGGHKGGIYVMPLDLMPPGKYDLIKIDCEGHEIQIIKGAKKYIEKHKPNILFETHCKMDTAVIKKLLGEEYIFRHLGGIAGQPEGCKNNFLARIK